MSPFPKFLLCAGILLALAGCRSAPPAQGPKAQAPALTRLPTTEVEDRASAPTASPPEKPKGLAAIPVTHLVPSEEIPPPVPEQLEMDWLVLQVQERNPSLQSLLYAWQSAAQKYPQAVSLEDPMFMSMLAPASVNSATTEAAYVLEASHKFPWFG